MKAWVIYLIFFTFMLVLVSGLNIHRIFKEQREYAKKYGPFREE